MFYFTCNESKIYESFTFWNKLQEKNELFDHFFFLDVPVRLLNGMLKSALHNESQQPQSW